MMDHDQKRGFDYALRDLRARWPDVQIQPPTPAPAGGSWWCWSCYAWVAVSAYRARDGREALCFGCGGTATRWYDAGARPGWDEA